MKEIKKIAINPFYKISGTYGQLSQSLITDVPNKLPFDLIDKMRGYGIDIGKTIVEIQYKINLPIITNKGNDYGIYTTKQPFEGHIYTSTNGLIGSENISKFLKNPRDYIMQIIRPCFANIYTSEDYSGFYRHKGQIEIEQVPFCEKDTILDIKIKKEDRSIYPLLEKIIENHIDCSDITLRQKLKSSFGEFSIKLEKNPVYILEFVGSNLINMCHLEDLIAITKKNSIRDKLLF